MKTIQTNNKTGGVIFIPESVNPTPRVGQTIRQVDSIPTVQKDQRLQWLPDDPENPQGEGTLQVVDIPLSIPERIQLWQFRAIMKINNLWEPALQVADNLDEPNRTFVLEHMERGQHVYRNSPTLKQFQQELNITDEQADQMFIEASKLKL